MLNLTTTHDISMATVYIMSTCLKNIEEHKLSINNQFHKSTKQWSEEMKGNLIVTIFNGYLFPSIVVAETIDNSYYKYVIDGTQRLLACLDFKNNKFKIDENLKRSIIKYQKVNKDKNGNITYKIIEFDLRGKFYKDLPEELQDEFDNYNIHIDLYSKCSDEDIAFHIHQYNIIV